MADMSEYDLQAFKHFLSAWKTNWDLNQYYRTRYDEALEYYHGYRNENKYPLAYNLSFNKLMPRIMTVLSRFMEQLYQAGTSDLVSVRPRKRSDVERAPRVQGLLNYQLECLNDIDQRGGSYLFNFQWMFSALTLGKGIVKQYWRKDERIAPRRVAIPIPVFDPNGRLIGVDAKYTTIEEPQIVYNGPYAEIIHPKMFNPHPHYKNIQLMPTVGCLYRRSIDYLKEKEREGIYRNIDKIGWTGTRRGTGSAGEDSFEMFAKSLEIEGALQSELDNGNDTRSTPEVDIMEQYGRYIFPEDDEPYEVGSGYKIKGKESEAICHIANYKTLISLQKNTYGTRPFFDIGAYHDPELFWDIGIIDLGKNLQEEFNTMGNLRLQNAMMLVNNMLKVRMDADINPAALVWKPFGIIPVEGMDDVAPMEVSDMFQSNVFTQQKEFFEECISDITGMYPYNMGQTPSRQEHVGTIYSLQSVGEARTKLLMMTMDHQGFKPFLKYMMLLNTWHYEPDIEARVTNNQGTEFTPLFPGDIHVGYDFSARYTGMEPALGKQFRAQQLIQYAQMWQQSPFMQQYQFQKAILELLDFHDSDRYLKTPEQVAQEQQAMMQQQVQAEMMGFQMQDQINQKQAKYEMERDIVKGFMK